MPKRATLYFTIEAELRSRYEAAAALHDKTLKQWAMEAMQEKLAREIPPPTPGYIQETTGSLQEALATAEKLDFAILKGIKAGTDAAKDIQASREERLRHIGG